MREFDLEGIRLAEYQAKIFEASVDLECSTAVFMRRFLHSDLLEKLDKNNSVFLTLVVSDAMDSLNEQFGLSSYGKVKASKDCMFWMGYCYRYISYTRNISVRFLLKSFKYQDLISLYYVYHTQNMEWCISNLLELYGIDEKYFDPNERIKRIMKGCPYILVNTLSNYKN